MSRTNWLGFKDCSEGKKTLFLFVAFGACLCQNLRILAKGILGVPETKKEVAFPDTKAVVFCCPKFEAQDDKRIVLIPTTRLGVDDPPEPFMYACEILRCPVIYVSMHKYYALLRGLRECAQKGSLEPGSCNFSVHG